jgi:hypothetical protein
VRYSVAILIDPYRGLVDIVETVDDYAEAWRRAGVARRRSPERIFLVLSTETREDPKPAKPPARQQPR